MKLILQEANPVRTRQTNCDRCHSWVDFLVLEKRLLGAVDAKALLARVCRYLQKPCTSMQLFASISRRWAEEYLSNVAKISNLGFPWIWQ